MGGPHDDAPGEGAEQEQPALEELAPMDFSVLVLSLRTSAMMQLGQGKGPGGEPLPVDLALARHTISMLSVLEEKTKGNLTGDEERLLSQVLFDLRMEYVTVAKRQAD